MPTFEVDDQFHAHPKTAKAGNEALGVWVKAGSWCASYLTNGAVPRDIAGTFGGTALWTRLVTAGLVDETEDGYQLHDYLHWNRPASDILSLRAKAAEKKRDQRAKMRARSKCPPGTGEGTSTGTPPIQSPGESRLSPAHTHTITDPDPPVVPQGGQTPAEAGKGKQTRTRKPAVASVESAAFLAVRDCYFAAFEQARGAKPPFDVRSGGAIHKLLAAVGGDPDRACRCVRNAFADSWWRDKATIGTIASDPARHEGATVKALPTQTRSGLLIQRDDENKSYADAARERSRLLFADIGGGK